MVQHVFDDLGKPRVTKRLHQVARATHWPRIESAASFIAVWVDHRGSVEDHSDRNEASASIPCGGSDRATWARDAARGQASWLRLKRAIARRARSVSLAIVQRGRECREGDCAFTPNSSKDEQQGLRVLVGANSRYRGPQRHRQYATRHRAPKVNKSTRLERISFSRINGVAGHGDLTSNPEAAISLMSHRARYDQLRCCRIRVRRKLDLCQDPSPRRWRPAHRWPILRDPGRCRLQHDRRPFHQGPTL
jgi:hypothetical protein